MSTDPYRFVIPRPDPPPTKTPLTTYLRRFWNVIPGPVLVVLVAGLFVASVLFGMIALANRADRKIVNAAETWTQAHHGQILSCHHTPHMYYCKVRLEDGDYRVVYDNADEPLVVGKEIP